jgi:tetratricopeptide (TPR) repeat protein
MNVELVAALTLLVLAIVGIPAFLALIDRRKQRSAEAQLYYNRAMEKVNRAENIDFARSLDDPLRSELQQDAVDLFFQCLSKRPDRKTRVYTLFQLGHVFLGQGRIGEAEKRLSRALQLDRRHKETLYDLAMIYKDQGKITAAKKSFKRVQKLDPSHEGTKSWLKILESMESDGP